MWNKTSKYARLRQYYHVRGNASPTNNKKAVINFATFVENYSSSDFNQIKFEWNGKHGEEFYDPNYDFRMQLCKILVPNIQAVDIKLIRDLYLELAKSSNATFGVYVNFHVLGNELLSRSTMEYLMDYLEGASQTMDTYLTSGKLSISKERAREIEQYINSKLRETISDKEEKLLKEIGKRRFEYLAHR